MSHRRGNLRPKIEELARAGLATREIARQLSCDRAYIDRVRQAANLPSPLGRRDEVKFSDDDGHAALALDHGGFCALSERRDAKGNVYVCLPVIWPMRERAA